MCRRCFISARRAGSRSGPIAVQASRILLYLVYFFAGVGIGAVRFDKGLLAADGGLARRWPVWLAATIVTYGCIIALIYIKHGVLPDVNHQPLWWQVAYALAFVSYSAAQTFNILALFLRFDNDGSSILDPLRDSAYGIYLIHYDPGAVAAILPVRSFVRAGDAGHRDHQGDHRLRADAGVQLGRDRGAAEDPGRDPRALIQKSQSSWHQTCIESAAREVRSKG